MRTWQVRLLDGRALGKCLSLLVHCFREGALPKRELVRLEMCLGGVSPDVSDDVLEVFAIANEAVEVVVLPELALKTKFFMDHARRASFPGEEHFFEQPVWVQHHEHMHVIRHDHI